MTKFIESAPQAFPLLAINLFQKHGRIIIQAPGASEAAGLYNALSSFNLRCEIFNPPFLLMERGELESSLSHLISNIIENPPDITILTPLSRRMKIPAHIFGDPLKLKKGSEHPITPLLQHLASIGYEKVDMVQDFGEFALKGEILDIASPLPGEGFRIEFFDEEIERIHRFSLLSQRNISAAEEILIHPLLFARKLPSGWQDRLGDLIPGKGMRELMEIEEAIEAGAGSAWDLYPLMADDVTIEEKIEGTVVVWEEMRGDISGDEELGKLSHERRIRRENNTFSPLEMADCFTERTGFEISVSAFHSRGESIGKFPSATIKPSFEEENSPILLSKRYGEENALLIFDESGSDIADKLLSGGIEAIPVDSFPMNLEKGTAYVIENKGWFSPESLLHLTSDHLILLSSSIFSSTPRAARRKKPLLQEEGDEKRKPLSMESLSKGEYIVHYNYGIALFDGVNHIKNTDCLVLIYENDDRVYLPVYNMNLVYRYRWEEGYFPKLSNLRTGSWEKAKKRIENDIEHVAEQILQLYAKRSIEEGFSFETSDEMVRRFEKSFPYNETDDQATSIRELFEDMSSGKVVDRLLCGDVGFGKTEVAMRGCIAAVASGKQAAVLVPTTVLAFQHFRSFKERFADFPIKIEMMSRFYSPKKQKQVAEEIKLGKVDIVVGTHRLLSKDLEFADLGFLVVDEEHRFGVFQKERIREIKDGVATLSMTATPIPRTLQMSLLGLREISFIKTPPRERKPVKTHVLEYSEEIVKESILRELQRGGQIYFVHNRIESLGDMKGMLQSLIPDLKIATAHGRMAEEKLEQVMVDFVSGSYDLLLATSLIESGIDIPQVNTIIINRADMFGLAQLYQLRGRVGRWNRAAYAYLMVPSLKTISEEAYNRLSVIKRFDRLGSGYSVAMEDLNIRGGGNILGFSQTGKLRGVGYDLYLEMLRRRIDQLKRGDFAETSDIELKTHLTAFIPENYIESADLRIGFYRKIGTVESATEIRWIRDLFTENYGPVPGEVENLFKLMELKIQAKEAGISAFETVDDSITLHFSASSKLDVGKLMETVSKLQGTFVDSFTIRIPAKGLPEYQEIIRTFQ